jgi:hypothetical protein
MGGYRSTAVYSGDFDLRISFSLLEWPSQNGVRVGLATLSDDLPLSFWNMERVSGGASEQFGDVYLTDYNTSLGVLVSTADTSGALRVARTGSTISAWYAANGAWQLIRSEVVSAGALHFSFGLVPRRLLHGPARARRLRRCPGGSGALHGRSARRGVRGDRRGTRAHKASSGSLPMQLTPARSVQRTRPAGPPATGRSPRRARS